jgi:hypothetical protein
MPDQTTDLQGQSHSQSVKGEQTDQLLKRMCLLSHYSRKVDELILNSHHEQCPHLKNAKYLQDDKTRPKEVN